MKSNFKKFLAAALVLCLALTLLPAAAFASGPEGGGPTSPNGDPPTNAYVKVVNGYGTLPTNGTVKINGTKITQDNFKEGVSVEPGKDVKVTVEPNEGNGLFSITSKEVTPTRQEDGTYTFTVPEDADFITLTVVFRKYRDIQVESQENGTIKINGSAVSEAQAMELEVVDVEVTAKEGFEVGSVYYRDAKGNVTPIENGHFVMPRKDVTVCATFTKTEPEPEPEPPTTEPEPDTYDVTCKEIGDGRIWADKDSGLEYRDWVTITIDPSEGSWLESLTNNGVDVADQVSWKWSDWYGEYRGTYTFRIREDTKIVATFTSYDDIACFYDGRYGNVTVKVWDGYSRKFVTTNKADKGDLVAVIVEPESGYMMEDLSIRERWSWDSVSYDASKDYSGVYYFRMPSESVNIYVDFVEALSDHRVYVDKASDGTLKVSTDWAREGQLVYITAVPDKGYDLVSLFVKTAKGDYLKVYDAEKADTYYFYMPDQYVSVSAVFGYETSELPFADVSYKSWYYDAVKFVYAKGIMDGVSYYRFDPDGTITRGMVVTMLWRMAGEPYEGPAGFTDVASGRYYSTAVAWAAKNGIVEGMSSTTFAPNQAITREQLAAILYRYAKWLGFSGAGSDISGYADAGKVSGYAYDAMCWAVRSGVVTGTTSTRLDPQGTATRAAAAQMFMNFYNYIN